MEIDSNIKTGIGITLGIALLFLFNRIKKGILVIFGGSLDKMEFAGICFLLLLIYMVVKEANREHEWSLFNEVYILVIASGACAGLGLKSVLNTIKHVKGKIDGAVTEETESPK